MDGQITARGGNSQSVQAGGGSGGSIMIHAYTIDGDGLVSVAGGGGHSQSEPHGGGGGGGRVAVYYHYNFFVGKFIFFYWLFQRKCFLNDFQS